MVTFDFNDITRMVPPKRRMPTDTVPQPNKYMPILNPVFISVSAYVKAKKAFMAFLHRIKKGRP